MRIETNRLNPPGLEAFKRTVINAYCHGKLPKETVTKIFRLLPGLRGA